MNLPENFPEILDKLRRLSFQAMGYSSPNPPVACVITDLKGMILAEAHTQRVGENHAEREAYKLFKEKYKNISEIKHLVFVTLEPCTHFGRTPPCLDLILEYKPSCVYYGLADPNPLVRKRDGFLECSQRGIRIEQNLEIKKIASEFLTGFISRLEKNRPQFFIKSAISREGFYSNSERTRLSLSNIYSNQITQMLRAKLDAVIVGPKTVYRDLPRLDFRGFISNRLEPSLENNITNFMDCLFYFSFEKDSLDYHNLHINEYQPYRIFILSLNQIPEKEFFDAQSEISMRAKKSIFVLLDFDEKSDKHASLFQKLSEISLESPEILLNSQDLYPRLIELFQKYSLNTVLIEGGNLLYSLFSKNFQERDSIYLIKTNKEIENGLRPEIGLISKKKKYEKNIDTDTWEVYGE
ncbi:MAG TPA: bifunctional diaminohydroxyphosphoribosylaminopyrimidine deaminase/5-amino-6-(5-phosphoribosylamino)uracil reductase [Leptospiraceae bacterium]|nr:bifunctional diaminohydroxyphosphoribosylaminopyrimidine deaminase/5-amino-6-(5-phosphoribosylamino)uracil reductase [Leptospiraceae bacterium]HMX33359.1 bifunctional diaminohydroxyphosphoribosylaminopyrimidine deaminase/5-amino-6-(5-phosphoribosylamino)uracil reductase [Leptospiraceae bacterium]HMY31387.1 bifunctional diaminohydroxyphosphoribosylaminopyrimidine deaminase/5-amino-6-(5-phosphoribosylamino)uracil reductase [Leptospiraceae bacterium]HMZ64993.1 bifunctional diaminohydroxyphosphor